MDKIDYKKEWKELYKASAKKFSVVTVPTMHDNGYQMNGKHHEIYLSDTRRGDPKNWKTIIRQPISI